MTLTAAPAAAPAADTPTAEPIPSATVTVTFTPTPASTPTPQGCQEYQGTDEDLDAPLPNGAVLQARVHLPPCYRSDDAPYPLLIMLHGQGSTLDQWPTLGFSSAADTQALRADGLPFIVVYVTEKYMYADPFETTFSEDIVSHLIPALEEHYNLCNQSSCRAIGGLSRGASWAALLAIDHPEMFSIAGMHSIAPFFGLQPRLRKAIAAKLLKETSWYFDTGQADQYRASAREFEQFYEAAGLSHEWHLAPGGHTDAYWAAHVAEYAAWYAKQFAVRREK